VLVCGFECGCKPAHYIRLGHDGTPRRVGLQTIVGEGSFGLIYRAIPQGLGCFYPTSRTPYAVKLPTDPIQLHKEWKNMLHLQTIDPHGTYHARLLGGCYVKSNHLVGLVLSLALSDLSSVLSNHTRPPQVIATMLKSIHHALTFFHQKELAHGDVKPENVLVFTNDRALLSDWEGMVRLPQPNPTTCTYLPPDVHRHRSLLQQRQTWPLVDFFAWLLMASDLTDAQLSCFHSRSQCPPTERLAVIVAIQHKLRTPLYPYPDLRDLCDPIIQGVTPGTSKRVATGTTPPHRPARLSRGTRSSHHPSPVASDQAEIPSTPPWGIAFLHLITHLLPSPSSDQPDTPGCPIVSTPNGQFALM